MDRDHEEQINKVEESKPQEINCILKRRRIKSSDSNKSNDIKKEAGTSDFGESPTSPLLVLSPSFAISIPPSPSSEGPGISTLPITRSRKPRKRAAVVKEPKPSHSSKSKRENRSKKVDPTNMEHKNEAREELHGNASYTKRPRRQCRRSPKNDKGDPEAAHCTPPDDSILPLEFVDIKSSSKCESLTTCVQSSHIYKEDRKLLPINYGSEEDTDEHDEGPLTLPIPRTARVYFDTDEDDRANKTVSVVYHWPPALPASRKTDTHPPTSTSQLPVPGILDVNDIKTETNEGLLTETLKPRDMFEFDWREYTLPLIPPEARKETFTETKCGPTAQFDSPYDAFVAIWNREIMDNIAQETNRYVQQIKNTMINNGTFNTGCRIANWKDTNADELYLFFAIKIATGIVVKTRIDEYWNTALDIFSTPSFFTTMSYNRFYLLNRFIHFNNISCDPESVSRAQAKIQKVQPLLDHLNSRFSNLYVLRQNIVVHESLTQWNGLHDVHRYFDNKASEKRIKSHEVCESQSGYLWRFELHAQNDATSFRGEQTVIPGIIPNIVLRLLRDLEHKGHTIWMDNNYNCPALARVLKTLGFDCVGTLRTTGNFVPKELATLRESDMVNGHACGCTSGDVDLVLWKDGSRIPLISTYHGMVTATYYDYTNLPTLLHDYNVCMRGIDKKDQIIASYPIERKTRVWYKKFFKRLLNYSAHNAFILYKHNHNREMHRDFRISLVNSLIKHHQKLRPSLSTRITFPQDKFSHYPAEYPFLPGGSQRSRRQCKHCSKRTGSFCFGCNVPLCTYTCFRPYHIGRET